MPDPNKSLLDRLADFLTPQPTSPAERRQELIETLREAQSEGLIDADALSMIEGVFQVGQLCARDILVPRAQIDWIDINLSLPEVIQSVIAAAHSRFPVYEGSKDNVIGILWTAQHLICPIYFCSTVIYLVYNFLNRIVYIKT